MIEEIIKQQLRIAEANKQLLTFIETAVHIDSNLRLQLAEIAQQVSDANHQISMALIAEQLPKSNS